jgi:hypothetical protein
MKQYTLEADIPLICTPAEFFPDGVLETHQRLHSLVPSMDDRRFYGLSWFNEQHEIVYWAAVEQLLSGEAEKLGCQTFLLPKGLYVSILITDFRKDVPAIGQAFEQLMAHPDAGPGSICVEYYPNMSDVLCLVKLNSNHYQSSVN